MPGIVTPTLVHAKVQTTSRSGNLCPACARSQGLLFPVREPVARNDRYQLPIAQPDPTPDDNLSNATNVEPLSSGPETKPVAKAPKKVKATTIVARRKH